LREKSEAKMRVILGALLALFLLNSLVHTAALMGPAERPHKLRNPKTACSDVVQESGFDQTYNRFMDKASASDVFKAEFGRHKSVNQCYACIAH
jgi:hypothetical protein